MKKKEKNIKKSLIVATITCMSIITVILLSLIFSSQLEIAFALKPDVASISEGALEVHFVDVGQGDATLIRFPNNKTMLIDAGTSDYADKLINYIDNVFFKNNEKHLNYVLLTHSHSDHYGGMIKILDNYTVDVFYRPAIIAKPLEQAVGGITYSTTKGYVDVIEKVNMLYTEGAIGNIVVNTQGIKISAGEATVDFVAPLLTNYANVNNFSPVILLSFQNKKFIFSGDAEKLVENAVVTFADEYELSLDIDVLKVGHHGSNTSTTQLWLEKTTPDYAVISVGKYNSYGHPSNDVLLRLSTYGGLSSEDIYTTSSYGNIISYVNSDEEIAFLAIADVDNFLFVDWEVIVIISIGGILLFFYAPYFSLYVYKLRKKRLKNKSLNAKNSLK